MVIRLKLKIAAWGKLSPLASQPDYGLYAYMARGSSGGEEYELSNGRTSSHYDTLWHHVGGDNHTFYLKCLLADDARYYPESAPDLTCGRSEPIDLTTADGRI
jgi:hypothetical protein